jgi:hypothetical protein
MSKTEVIELCSKLLDIDKNGDSEYLYQDILFQLHNKTRHLINNININKDKNIIQKNIITKKFDERDDHICTPFCCPYD